MFPPLNDLSTTCTTSPMSLCDSIMEIEACFRQGWILMDNGEWTEAEFDRVYGLSRQISEEIMVLRKQEEQDTPEPYYPLIDPTRHK